MKLDIKSYHYLTGDDWRVLTAFEMGSKNHEVVPTPLAVQLSGLRTGANTVYKSISTLAKAGLIAKVKNAKYDGYRLSYGGLDYLALHAHQKSKAIIHVGSTMGVGKESDIRLVTSPGRTKQGTETAQPVQSILKIHRLGRTSFRTASTNRSYLGRRNHVSWQHLSRLSAQREFLAMKTFYDAGFPVPIPIAHSRHTVVMSLIPGLPLRQVSLSTFGEQKAEQNERIATLYADLLEVILRFGEVGVIHGDMNEFNVLIEGALEDQYDDEGDQPSHLDSNAEEQSETKKSEAIRNAGNKTRPNLVPHVIDFPQVTSLSHPQAREFFDRDVEGIKAFFRKRYHFEADDAGPTFEDAQSRLRRATEKGVRRLDVDMEAAGYSKKKSAELEQYYAFTAKQSDEEGYSNESEPETESESEELAQGEEPLSAAPVAASEPATAGVEMPSGTQEEPADLSVGAQAPLTEAALNALPSHVEKVSINSPTPKPRAKLKAAAGWSI